MARPDPSRAVTAIRAVRAVAPLAAPLGGLTLALFLLGRLLDVTVSGGRDSVSPVGALLPLASPLPVSPNVGSDALTIDALAVGRYAHVRGGTGLWPRRGVVERFRLDAPPRAAAAAPSLSETGALDAVEAARALLGSEYRALELLASRLVIGRYLGPEEAGTSIAGAVPSQAGDTVLAERAGWLILFKAEVLSDSPRAGWIDALPGRTLVELLLIDAASGALLLRPPAALFADFEAVQLAHHPALDRTRPLNPFGDAAP